MLGVTTQQQLVRCCLCLMAAMAHTRGPHHRNGNKASQREYEFGRVSTSHVIRLDDRIDHEARRLEDFLKVDLFSMSMSMGTGAESKLATLVPVPAPLEETNPPTDVVVVEKQSSIPCGGATSTAVVFAIEVELAAGKTEFLGDLENALTNALSKTSYAMCDPRRGLKRHRKRKLEDDPVLLSPLIVIETGQPCAATSSSLVSSCQTASVAMEAYGTDDRDEVVAAVDSITKDDSTFDSELTVNGIVDVRVVETTSNRGTNIAESNSSTASSSTVKSSQTVMAVVLSVAAVTLVVAIILRQGAKRRRAFGYGPTMEEVYDESHCLGIQSLERMEHSSDHDTHYTPESEYPPAASF